MKAARRPEEIDENERTISNLRVLVREINDLWLAGDREVIPEAERALIVILHKAATRFRRQHLADDIR